MAKDTENIDNWVENAIDKVESMLNGIMLMRRNKYIRWNNLEITDEVDFLKGYLLAEIIHESSKQFHLVKSETEPC